MKASRKSNVVTFQREKETVPKSPEAARLRLLDRFKPKPKIFPCLRVRLDGPKEDPSTRVVDVANLPPDGLSEWVLRELSSCFPEYHFLTPDGEPIAVSRIHAIIGFGGNRDERTHERLVLDDPTPFTALQVMVDGLPVGIANVPATETGIRLIHRLLTGETLQGGSRFRQLDFLTTDYGWLPIGKIDPDRIPYRPEDPAPKRQLAREDWHTDGDCYDE